MSRAVVRFVFPRMNVGGAEKHAVLLASGLRKRGWDAGIATIFEPGVLAGDILKEGIPLTSLGGSGWGPSTLVKIFNWLRSSRIDILHTYLFGFHFFAGFPARLLLTPVILSSRREIAHWQKRRHFFTEKLGNLFTDRVICCSQAVEQWTKEREGLPPEKLMTIYNGIDLKKFHPSGRDGSRVTFSRARDYGEPSLKKEFGIPESAPVVGTVANFSYEKGYPYLLEAAALILKADPQVRILFVGSGPLEKEIRSQIGEIPGRERIILTGSRADTPRLLEAMDLFVLSSVIEGFPNVLLEASAMACPVIATEVGGIPELIESGENGLLVPPQNGKALAEAVLNLLENPAKARPMALRAQEKIQKKFNLDRMLDDYESLYYSLLEEKLPHKLPLPETNETVPFSSN